MRFMVGRVRVFSVPAGGKVDLGTDAAGTDFVGYFIVVGGGSGEVEAEEGDGLLCERGFVVGA